MTNYFFILIQVFVIIFVIGRTSFFTRNEILTFALLNFIYIIATYNVEHLDTIVVNTLDLLFFGIVYFLEIILIYKKKHSLFLSSIFVIIQNTILAIIWTISYDLPYQDLDRRYIDFKTSILQFIILFSTLFLLNILNKKFNFIQSFLKVNKKYNFYSSLMLIINAILLFIRQYMLFKDRLIDYYYITFILFLFTLICTLIIIFINQNYKQTLSIKVLTDSTQSLENQNMLSQEFKHDYKNILSGLNEYLINNEIEQAKNYLHAVTTYSSELTNTEYYFLIKEIPFPAIQSILFKAIKNAKEKELDLIIDVQSYPYKLDIDLIDFIRCLTILINNALEHATEKIYIGFNGSDGQLKVTVKNTYSLPVDLSNIFQKNYSTKEDHPGIGLFIFKKILNSYNNTYYHVDKTPEWITFTFVIE